MLTKNLHPVIGTYVRRRDNGEYGVVRRIDGDNGVVQIFVQWNKNQKEEWVSLETVTSGYSLGMDVIEKSSSKIRASLGEGVVLDTRVIGGREQVLVEFYDTGHRHWLPYQNLVRINGTAQRFLQGAQGRQSSAEKFRLRTLAYAIEEWNANTGAFAHLDIDPLPHQIHLVHHILSSGNLNWLIADDVGLGKTIEVGMLLAALKQRGKFDRILLVTPAGLVKQWKDELHNKFGFSDFRIYGDDFNVREPREWKLYDRVIGSIDRLKQDGHKERLLQSSSWDLVIFDEAHRLSRRQYGMKFDYSDRFKLAAQLRNRTGAFLLLTGTPHQGMQDKFQALLELLRPNLRNEIRMLDFNRHILKQMVVRNNKSEVTDNEGNLIFRGRITSAVNVPISEEQIEFDKSLQKYIREGYAARDRKMGKVGRAIGFVMTTYRKLAASSIAAIEEALKRRLQKLEKGYVSDQTSSEIENIDERYIGEWEENRTTPDLEFFEGELCYLKDLIVKAHALRTIDEKISSFVDILVSKVIESSPLEKVVIFTEYIATQNYIVNALVERFGPESVVTIHGSLDYIARAEAISTFEDKAQFLVSTEAGGEGINLHRKCHVMANFDLPWNPMRLVQRVGRLYRYGQKEKVLVFNVYSSQTLDSKLMNLLYQRIEKVVNDMATLGGEFKPGLEAEILGELADLIDVEDILEKASEVGISRTQEQVEAAILSAREAMEKQRELFEYVTSFNRGELKEEIRIGPEHVWSFILGMCAQFGIQIVNTSHKGAVLDLRLPEDISKEIIGRRTRIQITLDRGIAAIRKEIDVMDFDSPLLKYFLRKAKEHRFDGRVATVGGIGGKALLTVMLRWQNDQGMRIRQEFSALLIDDQGNVNLNPSSFGEWLLKKTQDGKNRFSAWDREALFYGSEKYIQQRLASICNSDLHPESMQWITGAWLSPMNSE